MGGTTGSRKRQRRRNKLGASPSIATMNTSIGNLASNSYAVLQQEQEEDRVELSNIRKSLNPTIHQFV